MAGAGNPRDGGSGGTTPPDVLAFLGEMQPFVVLSSAEFERAAMALRIAYHPRGSELGPRDDGGASGGVEGGDGIGADGDELYLLRSGAVDLLAGDRALVARLGDGESFLLGEPGFVARVIEDALVYRLPAPVCAELRRVNRDFDRHFTRRRSRRLRRAARLPAAMPALPGTVRDAMSRDVLTVASTTSVREAAEAMARRRVSSALVMDDTDLVGIVTDRDLRSRVVAPGLPGSIPVHDVMTPSPVTSAGEDSLLDAMLRMALHEVHHLPVVEGGAVVGMLSSSDLVLARREDPVHLVQHIARQPDPSGVAALVGHSTDLLRRWAAAEVQPRAVSRLLTAISDAAVRRLIILAEDELGPAPAPWSWVAFGSQGRAEQLAGADQDNGIVIDAGVRGPDCDWYAQLARRVCDGLAACGYARCPGGVMATTDAWRAPLPDWRDTVCGWMRAPTEDAVMRISIFFDPRAVYGDAGLVATLQQEMLEQAGRNTIFQAALAGGILEARPPLGLFRRFVVDREGEHADCLDIKKQGVLPITEIVRLHAIANGVAAVNTDDRLAALAREGHLALVDARNLTDALHCIQRVRLQHHGARIAAAAAPDNHVDPGGLSRLDREQLRDAFTIIHEAQAGVRRRYRAGLA